MTFPMASATRTSRAPTRSRAFHRGVPAYTWSAPGLGRLTPRSYAIGPHPRPGNLRTGAGVHSTAICARARDGHDQQERAADGTTATGRWRRARPGHLGRPAWPGGIGAARRVHRL